MKKLISLIIPVFNEELNILPLYNAVLPVITDLSHKYEFELIFTDNHSSDATFQILLDLANKDSRVRAFRFSRNFGYQKSILTGYLKSKGVALIQLDCDLQDPPELIPTFLQKWEEGSKVVYGIRTKRHEGWIINRTRALFYRIVNFLSEDDIPVDVGDFRLIDRCIVNVLSKMNDQQPYLRGAIAAIGFQQTGIEYERSVRERGESSFNLSSLLNLALDGILNHSIIPLRLATFFGIFISLATLVAIIFYSVMKLFLNYNWPSGFTTIEVTVLTGIAVNSLFLGIIGEYLGRIYQQTKQKPLTVIEHATEETDVTLESA